MKYQLKDKSPQLLGEHHFIAPSADVIGDVVLHNNVGIWFNAVLRGDTEQLIVGENSNIQDNSVLHTDEGLILRIGNNVTVGHSAVVHGCEIGNNSLIGIGSVILNRAKIGNGCIIGANALITEGTEIPDYSMALGSPAKVVKQLDPSIMEMLALHADVYVKKLHTYQQDLIALPD